VSKDSSLNSIPFLVQEKKRKGILVVYLQSLYDSTFLRLLHSHVDVKEILFTSLEPERHQLE